MFEPDNYVPKDPRAPHYRRECLDILNLYYYENGNVYKADRTFYKQLKEQYPDLRKYSDKQILDFIVAFNKMLAKTIVGYRDGVTLPSNVGLFMVCTLGKRNEAIDHHSSEKAGKVIHYRNDHSEGYGGGVYYSTTQPKTELAAPTRLFENCKYWGFIPDKPFRQLIKEQYLINWKQYYMVPKSRRWIDMKETYQKKQKLKKDMRQIKEGYDEFGFGNDDIDNDE